MKASAAALITKEDLSLLKALLPTYVYENYEKRRNDDLQRNLRLITAIGMFRPLITGYLYAFRKFPLPPDMLSHYWQTLTLIHDLYPEGRREFRGLRGPLT